jgi:hypothetical protein
MVIHEYLSTACLHGHHTYCQSPVRDDGGSKRPAECKFCDAKCVCDCHEVKP